MLLINPSISIKSQNKLLSNCLYSSFPTGIGYLTCYLRKYNAANITIFDENINQLTEQKLNEALSQISLPRIVGISCLTLTVKRGMELANKIKRIAPDTTVIVGGIHPTVMPEDCLLETGVDIVVRGEGEVTLSYLYDLIKGGNSYYNVDGISFIKDKKIIHNKPRKLIENLDTIPEFPYALFEKDINKYRDFGSILTSRGCPYPCIFCSQKAITGGKYRYFSTERCLKEIGLLVNKYNQKKIWFIEDNMGVHKKRLFDLVDGIISCGYNQKAEFVADLRADSIDYDLIMKLKKANFTMFVIGAETGSEKLMKVINKKETVKQNNEAILLAAKHGIKVSAVYIFGLPTETREERKLTFKLSKKLPLDNVRFNIATPYPGTALYKLAKAEERLKVLDGWENFNVQYYLMGDIIPYYPKDTNKYLLIYDTLMANLRTYICFRGLKSLAKSTLSGGAVISIPKKLSFSYFIIILRLGAFILKRFVYILYKAKIEIVLKNISAKF